jgi:hypothetical protein
MTRERNVTSAIPAIRVTLSGGDARRRPAHVSRLLTRLFE